MRRSCFSIACPFLPPEIMRIVGHGLPLQSSKWEIEEDYQTVLETGSPPHCFDSRITFVQGYCFPILSDIIFNLQAIYRK